MPATEYVTLRLIAEAALPAAQRGQTYLQGEIVRQPKPGLSAPRGGKRFHLFCSRENAGSAALAAEVGDAIASFGRG